MVGKTPKCRFNSFFVPGFCCWLNNVLWFHLPGALDTKLQRLRNSAAPMVCLGSQQPVDSNHVCVHICNTTHDQDNNIAQTSNAFRRYSNIQDTILYNQDNTTKMRTLNCKILENRKKWSLFCQKPFNFLLYGPYCAEQKLPNACLCKLRESQQIPSEGCYAGAQVCENFYILRCR